jgi:hypothetical protein
VPVGGAAVRLGAHGRGAGAAVWAGHAGVALQPLLLQRAAVHGMFAAGRAGDRNAPAAAGRAGLWLCDIHARGRAGAAAGAAGLPVA